MNGWLTTYAEPDDVVVELRSLPIVIHAFTDGGIAYSAFVKDAVSSVELHPYGRRYNQWNVVSERTFTVIEVDSRGNV